MPVVATKTRENKYRGISAYQRIEANLRERIAANDWPAGMMLPSRKNLAAEYGVNLTTLQRAITALLRDGELVAEGGRGTFVAQGAKARRSEEIPTEKRTMTVGLLTKSVPTLDPDAPNIPPWQPLVNSIERSLARNGGVALHLDLYQGPDHELSVMEGNARLVEAGVDAIVNIVDISPAKIEAILEEMGTTPVFLAFVGGAVYRQQVLSVYYSSPDAGYLAASHILGRGCKRILYFSGCDAYWVQQRRQGVEEAIAAARMAPESLSNFIKPISIYGEFHEHETYKVHHELAREAAVEFLKRETDFDGVICSNDYNALEFMKVAAEQGRAAGRDYAIVGFDNIPPSRLAGLTTLNAPLEAMGEEVVRLCLQARSTGQHAMRSCLPAELMARHSTLGYKREARRPLETRQV